MSTLVLETEPLATAVAVTDEELTVELADGRRIMVPLAWYPRLLNASARRAAELATPGRRLRDGMARPRRTHRRRGVVGRSSQRREPPVVGAMAGLAARSRSITVADCLVDHRTRTVTVHRRDSGVKVFSENDTLDCADLLPGFSIPLKDIFRI